MAHISPPPEGLKTRLDISNPAALPIEYGLSPFTIIHENTRTLGPHRNIVYQPWTAQSIPLQPTYDDTVTCSAFFPTMHQAYGVDPTIAKSHPQPDEKHPRNASDEDALLMSNIVSKPDPDLFVKATFAASHPIMPILRRCDTVIEFLKAMYDLVEGIYMLFFLTANYSLMGRVNQPYRPQIPCKILWDPYPKR